MSINVKIGVFGNVLVFMLYNFEGTTVFLLQKESMKETTTVVAWIQHNFWFAVLVGPSL